MFATLSYNRPFFSRRATLTGIRVVMFATLSYNRPFFSRRAALTAPRRPEREREL